jgi:hypothetical protein
MSPASPDVTIASAPLRELVAALADARTTLLGAVETVPAGRRDERPRDGAWSAGEVLDHLAQVEDGSARLFAKRVLRARESGVGREVDASSRLGSLDAFELTNRARRLEAPEIVRPREGANAAEALAALGRSRAALLAAVADADGLDLGAVKATHGRLGEIDLYQWLLFLAQHERRHAEQIAEIGRTIDGGLAARPAAE